jgi:ATP-dependent DNA helicase PIF1
MQCDYGAKHLRCYICIDQEHLDIYGSLNKEQREGFDEILQHVRADKNQVFFVDGPRGMGKTFLYKALLAKVRFKGLIAITTATSGIATSILPGGALHTQGLKFQLKLGTTVCVALRSKLALQSCFVGHL